MINIKCAPLNHPISRPCTFPPAHWLLILLINDFSLVIGRAGQYLNTLYLNTVFKYIYCIYTLNLNTFFNLYLITVFKYFWSVFKYMYLNTFLNTFLHSPLYINNRSSVDWSANHGFKHFNAVTCCICLLLNNTVLYRSTLMLYFPIEKVYLTLSLLTVL